MISSGCGPRVVALMPTWCAERFVEKTLDALSEQTWPDLEVIVSDDASPDRTFEICQRYAARDPRFRVIRQARNLGWIGNVNALLSEADGEYFWFAFHDDLPAAPYVERCINALEQTPGAVLAYSDIELVAANGNRSTLSYPVLDGKKERLARALHVARMEGRWWIPNRGVFRATAARTIGGLRRNLAGEFSADWPWLIRMSLLGSFIRIPEVLVTKIYQRDSLSRTWRQSLYQRLAVTFSAIRAVSRSRIPIGESMILNATLVRAAAGQSGRAVLRKAGIRLPRSSQGPSMDR